MFEKIPGDSFVHKIYLYLSSFMTSAVWPGYHLHSAQACLMPLSMFGEKSVSKQHFSCCSKYTFLKGKRDKELPLCTCKLHKCILNWSPDRSWRAPGGKCTFCFWPRVIFHHLPASLPASDEISCFRLAATKSLVVIAWFKKCNI